MFTNDERIPVTSAIYAIRWIKSEYKNPDVYIIENGWADLGEMEDTGRIEYFHDHLQQVQDALLNDGCNVKAYTGKNHEIYDI